MTAATPTPPPPGSAAYAHERPSLVQGEGKADIVERLQGAVEVAETFDVLEINPKDGLLTDAIATIKGLRESDQRRLQLINQAKGERDEVRARCAELRAVAGAALRAFDDLVAQSYGVIGLHQNGDDAPWGELLAGGRYEEWLCAMEPLRQALHAATIADAPPAPLPESAS